MATRGTAQSAKSYTQTAGAADDLVLRAYGAVIQIVHRGTTDPIYFRLGATVAGVTDPTVAGDECMCVLPGQVATVPWPVTSSGHEGVAVKTICASAQPLTVQTLTARAF